MKKFFCLVLLLVQALWLTACEDKNQAASVTVDTIADVQPFVVPICVTEKCGVLNQRAEVLVPFGRTYIETFQTVNPSSLFVRRSDFWSIINPQDKTNFVENISESIEALTPGLFAAKLPDGWAIIDAYGKPINKVRYANIATTQNNQYMVYQTTEQQVGVLDAEGSPVARFFGTKMDFSYIDHLVILTDNSGFQLVDVKNTRSFPVEWNGFFGGANGMYVVRNVNEQWGVINAEGGVVMVPQSKYLIGVPSAGRIAYSDTSPSINRSAVATAKCGYLDFSGAVVIPAQFEACSPFGEKAAMVKKSGSKTFTLIDRSGKPLGEKEYYGAYWVGAALPDAIPVANPSLPSGATFTADSKARLSTDHLVPNIVTTVELREQDSLPNYGLLDLNTATYTVDPKYARLRVLSPTLIEFVPYDSADLKALDTKTIKTGLMDFTQKVLLEPSVYSYFVLEKGIPYVFGYRQDYTTSGFNVLSLDGKVVVEDYWTRLRYDPRFKAFFGYNLVIDVKNSVRSIALRAAYTESGKNIFQMKKDGGCQDNYTMVNFANQVLWNTNEACNPK